MSRNSRFGFSRSDRDSADLMVRPNESTLNRIQLVVRSTLSGCRARCGCPFARLQAVMTRCLEGCVSKMMSGSKCAEISGSSTSSRGLVRDLKEDRSQAWSKLLRLYGPAIYGRCRKAGLTGHDAADVMQEVFSAVVQYVGQFQHDPQRHSFRAWLHKITTRKLCDHFRRLRAAPKSVPVADLAISSDLIVDHLDDDTEVGELAGVVQRALRLIRNEFEHATWQAFWLAAVDGLPANEVGQRCGMSVGAVRQAKYRVLVRLRREIGDLPQ